MRLRLDKTYRILLFALLTLFPIVQICYLILFMRWRGDYGYRELIVLIIGILTTIVGDFSAFHILFVVPTKERLITKEDELTKSLMLSRESGTEREGFLLSALNDDLTYENMIKEILAMVEADKYDQAAGVLSEHFQNITKKERINYCENDYVNVIVREKDSICKNEDISFSVTVNVPQKISIAPAVLCSVFGNLLDNAIDACKKFTGQNKKIELKAGIKGEYLFIFVDNSADSVSQKEDVSRKHYGLMIVAEHVGRYNGHFYHEFDKQNRQYHAEVALINAEVED